MSVETTVYVVFVLNEAGYVIHSIYDTKEAAITQVKFLNDIDRKVYASYYETHPVFQEVF